MLPGLEKLIFKCFMKVSRANIVNVKGKVAGRRKSLGFGDASLTRTIRLERAIYSILQFILPIPASAWSSIPILTKALLIRSGDANKNPSPLS